MPGKLTKLLSEPHFHKVDGALWGMLHTFSNAEKKVQSFLDGHGIPNYLPCITVRNARTDAVSRKLQLKGFIFACWDTRRFPGLATAGNLLARDEVHHVSTEPDIMRSMEAYWKLELLSEHYDVEDFNSNESFASHTIQKGPLAGTIGFVMKEDGHPVFLLPLDQDHWYAKVHLPAGDFS